MSTITMDARKEWGMSATISECGNYRYRLERIIGGPHAGSRTFAYFGVNPSTADAEQEDQTTRKWNSFTLRAGGARYVVGNAFAYRSTDVGELALVADPIGVENDDYIESIIHEADVLVPCWGATSKVPHALRHRFDFVLSMLKVSGKPIMTFGFTKGGDPRHPLMLPSSTVMQPWEVRIERCLP